MPGLVDTGLRLLRSLVGNGDVAPAPLPGLQTALRGAVAVAITEACVAEVAGLGAGSPADVLTRAWEDERRRRGLNVFAAPLTEVTAPTPRGTLASAVGMALAGARATAFLSGPNLAGLYDLLTSAAGRNVPLVIHGVSRALNAHAGARGSGHEAWHAVSDSGVLQLFARNAQEAVDFALIGRRIAEATLRPVLVFMDEERCSAVTQDVRLPGAELIHRYLGAPGDKIDCTSPSQAMLFGPQRRRIPRWHDLERPVLHGAIQGREVWSLGAVGTHPFTLDTILPIIEGAFDSFAELTGRSHQLVRCHRVEDAEVVLLAQGSGTEVIETVVDYLRTQRKLRVGAVSLVGLRPFPGPALVKALLGKRHVAVLERVDVQLAEDPPMMRELRATFDKVIENHRHNAAHKDVPAAQDGKIPQLHSVVYGLGGYPIRSGDLVALVEELQQGGRPLVYLGMDFSRRESRYPKRQVLLDQLKRLFPGELAPGLTGYQNLDVRPEGTSVIAVHRMGGTKGTALAADVGRILQVVLGGAVRGRAGESWERWRAPRVDRVVHAPSPVDPGASGPVDIALVLGLSQLHGRDPLSDVSVDGAVLVADAQQPDVPLLPAGTWRQLQSRGVRVYAVPCAEGPEDPAYRERVFAMVLRLVAERGAALPPTKKILIARRSLLDGLSPQQVELRMDAFEGALDLALEPVQEMSFPADESIEQGVPMAVRHFTRADGTYDSLPRFWDQVGILFRDGQLQELLPDPYLATGVVPALSSTFNDFTPLRRGFPVWEPVACSGCGRCWTGCPDSAVGPLALGVPRLLEGAMGLAADRGVGVDPLRPVLSKLAGRVSKQLRETETAPLAMGPVLREAFEWFVSKAKLPADRQAALDLAFEALASAVEDLPISGTVPFFLEPERHASGTGEILSVAFNPDACKACGICAAACPEQAISMAPQTAACVRQAREHWQRWERLPDTAGETIARVLTHKDVGPVAAMLLSRACLLGLAGGDSAEAGSGEKVAVRLLLAAAEYELQPQLQRHLGVVEGLRGRLTDAIHRQLVQSLPTGDPGALALGLAGLQRPEIDLAELMQRLEGQDVHGRIDVAQLRRLADLAGRLQDLQWRLAQGPDGLGRARISLAVESGPVAAWAGAFPDNPFHVPVVVAGADEGIHLARGLFEGQLRAVQDDLRLVREARIALDSPAEYGREKVALDGLTWRDLTPEERRLVPPVVVVGHEDSLTGRNLSTLATVLDLELPVKILVLAGNELGLASGRAEGVVDEVGCGWSGTLGEVGLLALGRRRALVTQCSLAYPDQLFQGLTLAMSHVGPALVRVHAPSPGRHGFPVELLLSQCQLAVQSRAFPLFRYDPSEPGVFGACLHLDGNPGVSDDWARDQAGCAVSPAHWVATEERFAEHLLPLTAAAPEPTPFLEWLELPLHTRHGRTPFVVDGRAEPPGRLVVSPVLAAVAEERLRTWRTLQELAGVVTPFTARVRDQVESELQERHNKEIAQLRASHEQELEATRQAAEQELGARVRDSLLQLAGYGEGGSDTGAEG